MTDTPEESLGLRASKKIATRRALRRSAIELVLEHGLDGVTVEDIAVRAGVSPRTFFNYFPTKESALVGIDPDVVTTLLDTLRERPAAETPLQALCEVLIGRAPLTESDRDLWEARHTLARRHPSLSSERYGASAAWNDQLTAVFAERLGLEEPDAYCRLVAEVGSMARRTAVGLWLDSPREQSLVPLLRATFDLIAAGLPVDHSQFPPRGRFSPTRSASS